MSEELKVPFQFPPRMYSQDICVEFTDAASAAKAEFTIMPLFEGYEWAVTSRWDDAIENNLGVKERLDQRGVKGTFYLNSNSVAYLKGKDYRPIARKLLENGHTIGGHSLSHPYLSYVNPNRLFQEMAGVRIEWEAELDTLIHSFTFSFVDYSNPLKGSESQTDMIHALERAGYYHVAEYVNYQEDLRSDLVLSVIMPPENNPFEIFTEGVQWALNNHKIKSQYPAISHSMHGWYSTPFSEYEWPELEKRLDYLNQFPDLWNCNQNQYAAYWYQSQHTRLTEISRNENKVFLRLVRPELVFLNDPVPLTLGIRGINPEAVTAVSSQQSGVAQASRQPAGLSLWNIPHAMDQFLPIRIGRVENPRNFEHPSELKPDRDFQDIQMCLHSRNNTLILSMTNTGNRPLDNLHLTWRLPLAWKEGVIRKQLDNLAPGTTLVETLNPTLMPRDPRYRMGSAYFVAQLDFLYGNEPSRIYATCNRIEPPDKSFPLGNFAWMGPFDRNQFDIPAFQKEIDTTRQTPTTWQTPDGRKWNWHTDSSPGPVPDEYLDFEVIRTGGDWYLLESQTYLLHTLIHSPTNQTATLLANREDIPLMILNNQEVKQNSLDLIQGLNSLVMLYQNTKPGGTARHTACFFRLADPATGNRLLDIEYQLPYEKVPSTPKTTPQSNTDLKRAEGY